MNDAMSLTSLTVDAAHEKLRAKGISSVELTHGFLDRIHALNPRLNAYITVMDEASLAMARAADERIARGEDSPLLGVPIAIKDLFSIKDVRTTGGSKILGNDVPMWDATCVSKLRAQGAVFLVTNRS